MTNEKMYSTVCDMIRDYGQRDESADIAAQVISDPRKWAAYSKAIPFYPSAAALLVDAMESMDKKTTARGQLSAVKKFLSDNAARPLYRKMWEQGGYYCACDGYKAIRLKSDLPSLPHATPDDGEPVNLEKSFSACRKDDDAVLTLPTIGELKAFISAHKKQNKPFLLDGCVLVNPEYLLAAMQALPGATFYKPKNYYSPVYFKSDDGDGILLPVKPSAEQIVKLDAAYMTEQEQRKAEEKAAGVRTLEAAAAELKEPGNIARAAEIVERFKSGEYRSFAYVSAEMRDMLQAESERRAEQSEKEAAAARVQAVAAAVHVNEQDNNRASVILRQFERGNITEDEAKSLLAFPVSVSNRFALALPSHIETEAEPEEITVTADLLYRFGKEYNRIYSARDRVPGYLEAVDTFDKSAASPAFCELVRAFCERRGDYITSDREAAAFVFAIRAHSAAARVCCKASAAWNLRAPPD